MTPINASIMAEQCDAVLYLRTVGTDRTASPTTVNTVRRCVRDYNVSSQEPTSALEAKGWPRGPRGPSTVVAQDGLPRPFDVSGSLIRVTHKSSSASNPFHADRYRYTPRHVTIACSNTVWSPRV
jgi:hypothetical protein